MIISLFSSGGGGTGGKKVVALPVVDDTPIIYDGTTKSVNIYPYSTDLITVSGNTGQNAGTYNAKFTLKDKSNYMWSNTLSSDDQTVSWTIERAVGSMSASATSVEIGRNETKTVTITTTESTTISAASSDTSVATVSVSGNVVSITDGGTSGEATITVSAANSTNYTYGTVTISVLVKGLEIVTWANGTDEQIVAMVAAADAGTINLTDYWNIGDKRTVSLSAMAATGVGESHRAQNIVLVLVDKNNANYPYVTATSGRTYCSFVVQQENCLSSTDSGTTSDSERGYMNSSNTNTGSWNGCARRTWCNNVYRNAMPSTLRGIFKQVKVTTAQTYNGSTNQQSDDYFFLPAAAEVYKGDSTYGTGGTAGQATAYSNLTEFNALTRWKYYETTGNRVKKMGLSGAAYDWWERSPYYGSAARFCDVDTDGSASYTDASSTFGLAPCGCV